MSDEVWSRQEIASPCVKLCAIHPGAAICVGCHRTRDEIGRWSSYSHAERAAIMAELPARADRLTARAARPSTRRKAAES